MFSHKEFHNQGHNSMSNVDDCPNLDIFFILGSRVHSILALGLFDNFAKFLMLAEN